MVTQKEFAQLRGVTPKTCQIWRQRGLIVFAPAGGVDVEASEKLIDARPETFRGGTVKPKPSPGASMSADQESIDFIHGESLADLPVVILDEAATWPLREATRKKEIALALLRQLEFDKESGLVVPIADVAKEVISQYTLVRDRLLTIPGKLADGLVGKDRRAIETLLKAEVYEALSELHDPQGVVT